MDPILASFLEEQESDAAALSRDSDLVDIVPVGCRPYQLYVVRYSCTGLVRTNEGIVEANHFELGVRFPFDYWQRASMPEVLTWLGPANCYHPNLYFPIICMGHLDPGTPLAEIVLQCYEIITYQKATMKESDALNRDACAWARRNVERFPVDDRPMLRRRLEYRVEEPATPEGNR
jgi:hypothetical protein